MALSGGCHCGDVRYELTGAPRVVVICHCTDCRRSAGAPFVSWAMYPEASLTVIKGSPRTRNSSGTAMRSFCAQCGTGLFYRNAPIFPGTVDVQSATLDDPNVLAPSMHIQTAERLAWMTELNKLAEYERFPAMDPDP